MWRLQKDFIITNLKCKNKNMEDVVPHIFVFLMFENLNFPKDLIF